MAQVPLPSRDVLCSSICASGNVLLSAVGFKGNCAQNWECEYFFQETHNAHGGFESLIFFTACP